MHARNRSGWRWGNILQRILNGSEVGLNNRDGQRTLAGVKPGLEVSVTGFLDAAGGQQQHLQAYGLLPGRRIRVLAQHPVTIVQIEQTELAFEGALAACVLVGD